MKKFKIKDMEELKKLFESYGYFPTEEIVIEAYLALKRFGNVSGIGQDIYTMCFDGPAGAGKSSFVEAYKRVVEHYLDEEIEIINYQCNDTTGSGELVEEVGMVAVVVKDEKRIIIPGAITKAIQEVNKGKKVILFLDEFDKSRKETDVFFYGFLQSGKLNAVQLEDMGIDPKYKGNLQVVFCKNDFRELSGPLARRTRNIILDYMKPDLFYKVATNNFIGINEPQGIRVLINLVALIYNLAYENVKIFDRLPSASEMLIAIEDAYEITKGLNLDGKHIYSLIFKRLFKNPDDYQSFENLLSSTTSDEYKSFREFLTELKENEEITTTEVLMEKMSNDIFKANIDEKIKEVEKRLKDLENQKRILIEERMKLRNNRNSETNLITFNGGKLSLSQTMNIIKSFNDSTEVIRRGERIVDSINNANWTSIANVKFNKKNHEQLVKEIIDLAEEFGYKVYEDGILLNNNLIGLALFASQDGENSIYTFISSTQIVPSTYIDALSDYIEIFKDSIEADIIKININALMYNDIELPLNDTIENVYAIDIDVDTLDDLRNYMSILDLQCKDKTIVLEKCLELIDNKDKKLVK